MIPRSVQRVKSMTLAALAIAAGLDTFLMEVSQTLTLF